MWGFYLNGGIEAVRKHLCRDGYQCLMPNGSLMRWRTTTENTYLVEGCFQKFDGSVFTRQTLQILPDETILISYYAPGAEHPNLTYRCRSVNEDMVLVERKWAGEIAVDSPLLVTSRDAQGRATSYRISEHDWEATLTYNEKGLLAREEIRSPEGNGAIEHEWDEEGVLVVSKFSAAP